MTELPHHLAEVVNFVRNVLHSTLVYTRDEDPLALFFLAQLVGTLRSCRARGMWAISAASPDNYRRHTFRLRQRAQATFSVATIPFPS